MPRTAFVNGAYVDFADAAVHVEDRGLQFSDSVYEVVAWRGGRPLDMPGHLDRLERSLRELGQGMPMSRAALELHVSETVRRNRFRDAMAYIQVTRGVARRDHAFPAGIAQTLIITVRRTDRARVEASWETGVKVATQPDIRWGRCDIKTTGLLPNVLAKQAAREQGAFEAWLVDANGDVTEGSSTNAWIVTPDGKLVTRSTGDNILAGITRASVMDAIRQEAMTVEQRRFSLDEAYGAREAFLTSATSLVMPVVGIDGRVIGDGKPGPVARRLRQLYLAAPA
jgi:D-alanine transaminase